MKKEITIKSQKKNRCLIPFIHFFLSYFPLFLLSSWFISVEFKCEISLNLSLYIDRFQKFSLLELWDRS